MGIQNHSDRSLIKKKVKMIKVSAPVEKSTRHSYPAFSTRLLALGSSVTVNYLQVRIERERKMLEKESRARAHAAHLTQSIPI